MFVFLGLQLAVFLFVLVVLLISKGLECHMGRAFVLVTISLLAGGFAIFLLYLTLARSDAQMLAISEAQLAQAELQQARLHQVRVANKLVPVAFSAEAAGGEIPVEADLEVEQAATLPRPDWVDDSGKLVGDDYFLTVKVGPHATRQLCDDAMTDELRQATDRYIDQLIGSAGAGRLVNLPLSDVRRQVVQQEHQEIVEASFGPMVNLYALLKFDKKMQDRIVRDHEQALVQRRVGVTAGGMGLVVLVLGTLLGYLKLDTATRGYYSGRLKLAAAAVILSAVALGAIVAHETGVDAVLVGERSLAASDQSFRTPD